MRFFVGGYSPELHTAELDPEDGSMEILNRVTTPRNASFLSAVPEKSLLFATVESGYQSGTSGKVAAYRVDSKLFPVAVGSGETCGPGPCHTEVDVSRGVLAVANYGGENFSLLRLTDSGKPGELIACVSHEGHSVNLSRQEEPHPHATHFSPDQLYLFVCDLGTDQVIRYRVDDLVAGTIAGKVALTPPAGSGPRHLAFSPDGRHVYLVNELTSTLIVCEYHKRDGELSQSQEISMLPDGFDGESTAAEVAVHPSGRFVYASNRGHDSLAIFVRDPDSGTLTSVGSADTTGSEPRHFSIDPTGAWCIVANQNTDHVVSFRVNQETGHLRWTGHSLNVPAPSCALFWPASRQA